MQQRRLRLGDILDDYCPRERRITNHAVVAMIDETVKQTRCTTCDAEHEYKNAKVPPARRRKAGEATAQLVEGAPRVPADVHDEPAVSEDAVSEDIELSEHVEQDEAVEIATSDAGDGGGDSEPVDAPEGDNEEWPVHRRLIRATLPRPEGQTPERKAPDFTFRPAGGKFDSHRNNQRNRGHRGARQAQGSGQASRFGGQRQAGQGQGQRGPGGQGGGPHGQRHGNRPGQAGGNRPDPQGRGSRGGRKRGR